MSTAQLTLSFSSPESLVKAPKPKTTYCPLYECQLVRCKALAYEVGQMNSTDNAQRVVRELTRPVLENSTTEKFMIVSVDTKLKPIGLHEITSGTLDASLVHPREVFQPAMLANASGIFLVHNHPSGDLTPSRQDREVTDRLRKCGELLGIQVFDHIIVGHSAGEWNSASLATC